MKRRRSRRPRQDSLFSSPSRSKVQAGPQLDRTRGGREESGVHEDSAGLREEQSTLDKAREMALRFISRRMRTSREVEEKLASKGFDRAVISGVVERLKSVGLIDDVEYARAFLRTSLKLRPRSYRSLNVELVRKGVSREIAASSVKESAELVPEAEVAKRLLAPASRRYEKLPPGERRRKLFSFLARRGFSLDTISELLGEDGSCKEEEDSCKETTE